MGQKGGPASAYEKGDQTDGAGKRSKKKKKQAPKKKKPRDRHKNKLRSQDKGVTQTIPAVTQERKEAPLRGEEEHRQKGVRERDPGQKGPGRPSKRNELSYRRGEGRKNRRERGLKAERS